MGGGRQNEYVCAWGGSKQAGVEFQQCEEKANTSVSPGGSLSRRRASLCVAAGPVFLRSDGRKVGRLTPQSYRKPRRSNKHTQAAPHLQSLPELLGGNSGQRHDSSLTRISGLGAALECILSANISVSAAVGLKKE